MNNINTADPETALAILKEMEASYRERIPDVYRRSFKVAMNRRFSVATSAKYLQAGGTHGR